MKVLIVSDTHGLKMNFDVALEKVKPVDCVVHCGDVEWDADYVQTAPGCPVHLVAGNCDRNSLLDKEIVTHMGPYKVMIVHGHTYSVNYDMLRLAAAAKEKEVDIVMFGHTHIPVIEEQDGIVFLNPGSLTIPRQFGRIPTYAMLNIDDDGTAHFSIISLEKDGVKLLQTLDFKGKK